MNRERTTNILLAGGMIGTPLFVVVFLIEGATRPGYDALRNYVSDLALSSQGWEQIANFLVCGVLCIGFAVGLRRAWPTGRASVWGPILLGLFGLGLVVAGVFPTDPGRGYPPGAPLKGDPQTLHGYVHGINALIIFNIVLPIACFVLARRFALDPRTRGWATYSWVTGALILVLSVLGMVTAPILENGGAQVPIGLLQRVEIILGWAWLALTAWQVLRSRQASVHESVVRAAGDATAV